MVCSVRHPTNLRAPLQLHHSQTLECHKSLHHGRAQRESTGSQGGLEQSHHLGWWPEGLEGNDQNSFTYKLPTDDPLLLFYFNLLKDGQCFLNCRIILRDRIESVNVNTGLYMKVALSLNDCVFFFLSLCRSLLLELEF